MTIPVRTAIDTLLDSPARVRPAAREPLRVGLVQHQWHHDTTTHADALAEGVAAAAVHGAELVCLQELTLSAYFAITEAGPQALGVEPEPLDSGPTYRLAAALASANNVFVHASMYETANSVAPRGFNTAICVSPAGELVAHTRKMHIPVTAGYYEDKYFAEGDGGYPPISLLGTTFGFPTCWDQWFPEVARAYSLAGAEVLVYPTAIGSEPDHPTFDTQPLWQQVIRANGIMNGTFMIVPNRVGTEGDITFYGSSFISDPYGRVLVEAPRDEPCVLVADLDLDQRGDWLDLFPFFPTRRPDSYGVLTQPRTPT